MKKAIAILLIALPILTTGSGSKVDTPAFLTKGLEKHPALQEQITEQFFDKEYERYQLRVTIDHWKLIMSRDSNAWRNVEYNPQQDQADLFEYP